MSLTIRALALGALTSAASAQLATSTHHRLEGFVHEGAGGVLVADDHSAQLSLGGALGSTGTTLFVAELGLLPSADALGSGPPAILAVEPAFGHHAGGTPVHVHGLHLDTPGASFAFGDVGAVGLGPASGTGVDLSTPAGARGPVDVSVSSIAGDDSLADGFVYTPAVLTTPTVAIGGQMELENFSGGALSYSTSYALTATEVPFPPYGTLLIGPGGIQSLVDWTSFFGAEQASLSIEVPDEPALAGVVLHFQSAVITSLFPLEIELTNRASTLLVDP